jgi:uncharacterized damage-inducible protein DinB
MSTPSKKKINELVGQFNTIYAGTPWYGDSITDILDQVNEKTAFLQSVKNAHSIAQLVWHMNYWRQALIKRLKGDSSYKGSMKSEANWSTPEKLKSIGWDKIKTLLDESQHDLTTLLSKQNDSLLTKPYTEKACYEDLIVGILQHDLYHTGQIAYLKSILVHK